jgi:hypothetical protein
VIFLQPGARKPILNNMVENLLNKYVINMRVENIVGVCVNYFNFWKDLNRVIRFLQNQVPLPWRSILRASPTGRHISDV